MAVYYNENDPYPAQWLRNLIDAGLLPAGDVDDRDVRDVQAHELRGYDQHHFFAGVGGWPLALALAGWPPGRPVWSGSCPCQPFSTAGKRTGTDDVRHLWPEFRRLISECAPAVVFGEQVAGRLGREWLAGVQADLEARGYAVGRANLPAASVGAPHQRHRLWWVAYSASDGREQGAEDVRSRQPLAADGRGMGDADGAGPCTGNESTAVARHRGPALADGSRLADTGCERDERRRVGGELREAPGAAEEEGDQRQRSREATHDRGADDRMADADGPRRRPRRATKERSPSRRGNEGGADRLGDAAVEGRQVGAGTWSPGAAGGSPWETAVTTGCADGRVRRVEPGICPLAHGVPGRVGRLRAYGNAIVPQVAVEFIKACMPSL